MSFNVGQLTGPMGAASKAAKPAKPSVWERLYRFGLGLQGKGEGLARYMESLQELASRKELAEYQGMLKREELAQQKDLAREELRAKREMQLDELQTRRDMLQTELEARREEGKDTRALNERIAKLNAKIEKYKADLDAQTKRELPGIQAKAQLEADTELMRRRADAARKLFSSIGLPAESADAAAVFGLEPMLGSRSQPVRDVVNKMVLDYFNNPKNPDRQQTALELLGVRPAQKPIGLTYPAPIDKDELEELRRVLSGGGRKPY